mmetsp:Transcript_12058/g.17680  ORF Transcript_12058/g.17680 Transcript_12058/m.17680 type:complete len:474 (-) Transcript_12058:352-1773(-)
MADSTKGGATAPKRVVSLLGAATETIYRLGLGDRLVGRSHECDYPRACLDLPCVSRPRMIVDSTVSSLDIDTAVRNFSAAGEPVYKLEDEMLVSLEPDLLIAQDHCRVCAITPKDVENSACSNITQVIVRPSTLTDCLDDITTIATAMGVPERGAVLRTSLEGRFDRIREVVAQCSAAENKPRVALLEWCDPIMGCGYWLPELVEIAGGIPLHCPPPGGATPSISFEALIDSRPDVLVFALCGFGLTRAVAEIEKSWGEKRLGALRKLGCSVFVVDGNYLVNRSGPRVVESCESLAEAIHEDLRGHFGFLGTEMLASLDTALSWKETGIETGSQKIRPPVVEPTLDEPSSSLKQPSNPPSMAPADSVLAQLKCLQNEEIQTAFAWNSEANQQRWCGAERFEQILRGHDDFRRLMEEDATVVSSEALGNIATVKISLPKTDEAPSVHFAWTLVVESGENAETSLWKTERVAINP